MSGNNGGMYGLIFDNTFSKQWSKIATVVLLTYPSNAPPHSTNQLNAVNSSSKKRPVLDHQISKSASASNLSDDDKNSSTLATELNKSTSTYCPGKKVENLTNHMGVLSKRRRRKGQGFARRFFSLDFATRTLSYYYSRNSYALRGAIPLSFAAITTDEERREIIIDSGAEIWHLKASNNRDFDGWKKALAKASRDPNGINSEPRTFQKTVARSAKHLSSYSDDEETCEWKEVEVLVSKIAGLRDAVYGLIKDTANSELHRTKKPMDTIKNSFLPVEEETDYFNQSEVPEKRTFWRRKASSPYLTPTANGTPLATTSSLPNSIANSTLSYSNANSTKSHEILLTTSHDHSSTLLNDFNVILDDFSKLLAKNKRRRATSQSLRKSSIGSASTGEFFDAEPGDPTSQKFGINIKNENVNPSDIDAAGDETISDTSSISSDEDKQNLSHPDGIAALFPSRPKSLDPLPINLHFSRRNSVPSVKTPPPSLIHFLRKNVGKDLSTVSMPVSANEPISLLQRLAEQFEYAQLLDKAASYDLSKYRLLYVAAFAISNFSIQRCKERSLRKPFNPMLGETFELLRTENEVPGGFRFIAEKVSHRPVRIACQADSAKWCINHSPSPTNKFWGKSAEIITEGQVRLVLHLKDGSDELYSWNIASAFLRNVVMGEKYVEPVGAITIVNESTGAKAIIDFKQKGMFGGRSEDVEVETHGPDAGPSLLGTWTTSLRVVEPGKSSGQEIWHVGDLVDNATQKYGFTIFAANLNEITPIEEGKVPISDSRFRPDQRAVEMGDLDQAESIKTRLEERQRARRMEIEKRGEIWRPRWFIRAEVSDDGEEIWKLKTGKDGYWEERSKGVWTGVEDIFCLQSGDGRKAESPELS